MPASTASARPLALRGSSVMICAAIPAAVAESFAASAAQPFASSAVVWDASGGRICGGWLWGACANTGPRARNKVRGRRAEGEGFRVFIADLSREYQDPRCRLQLREASGRSDQFAQHGEVRGDGLGQDSCREF